MTTEPRRHRLSPEQTAVLQELKRVYPDARIAIIGAAALSCHIEMIWRDTADLDLVLTISATDLDASLSKLANWTRDPTKEQRWRAPNGTLLDLVPAPDASLAAREFVWPESRHKMNLAGIALALEAEKAEILPGLHIAIPSIPVIALLKMAAYVDRPSEREKDLRDLAHILKDYPPDFDDKFYSDEVLATGLEVRPAKAYILGSEMLRVAVGPDRQIVEQFLAIAVDGPWWGTFVRACPWHDAEDLLQACMTAFREAFALRPPPVVATAHAASSIAVTFIINGDPFPTEVSLAEPLIAAVEFALKETKNTGRKPEDWELRLENGERITDLTRTAEQLHLIPGTQLFLSLKAGAGGHAARSQS